MPIKSVLDFAKEKAAGALGAGAWAVDATAGNGHDALFLAQAVGPSGRVWAFDVQDAALKTTRRRLREEGVLERVTLVPQGHEQMREHLPAEAEGRVRSITFNLGYLPGGPDKALTTTPDTTLPALDAATALLADGGVLTVVCYTGHPGGREETEAVHAWAEALPQKRFHALGYDFINQQNDPPKLVIVERRLAIDD